MSDSEHEYESDDSPEEVVDNQIESESEDEQTNIDPESENYEHRERNNVEKDPTEAYSLQLEDDISRDSLGNSSANSSNTFKDTDGIEAGVDNEEFEEAAIDDEEGGSVDNTEGVDTTAHGIFGDDLSDNEAGEEVYPVNNSAELEEDGLNKPHGLSDGAKTEESDVTPVKHKRQVLSDSDVEDTSEGVRDDNEGPLVEESKNEESPPPNKKRKLDEGSGSEGEGEEVEGGEKEISELQEEVAELGDEGEMQPAEGEEQDVEEESGGEDEERGGTSDASDWDVMMQRRKDAMARARKRRHKDVDITANDDHIMAMIQQMKAAAEEDRHLNMTRKAATKKLQMLPTVITHLKKADLMTSFIECGILTALSGWLTPLPDHSLPHLKIRDNILDVLKTYPIPDSGILKSSKIGKAVMLLYRHPKESRKNREKAGKIINEWARPIFGLASDFKSLSRDEREERDYAQISNSKRERLNSGERRPSQDDEYEPHKPGDKGWVGRARVPMPSTNDYVVRPKWNAEQKYLKKSSKKVLNRYEKQLQKEKQRKMKDKTTRAVSISVEGRNMPL